jgi:ubiquinone/menaquinone biosynthesis C-methylase UbiE
MEAHPDTTAQDLTSDTDATVDQIRQYWDTHPLGLQYVTDAMIGVGTPEFYEHIRPWMNPYKFPWIMERIEREAQGLRGKRLLEIGCGLGYDSLEFIRRGVRVTAIDLTPTAVELARRHFEIAGVEADAVEVGSALNLPFEDGSFDAVWSNGVLHATGNTQLGVQEALRVVVPGGRVMISHFYRKPSWMYLMRELARQNIEYDEEDPPVNEFLTDEEILALFDGADIVETAREHYRALPACRTGLKAVAYKYGFTPLYNLLPTPLAKHWAYKLSVTAIRRPVASA